MQLLCCNRPTIGKVPGEGRRAERLGIERRDSSILRLGPAEMSKDPAGREEIKILWVSEGNS